jgi:hypothetical protein
MRLDSDGPAVLFRATATRRLRLFAGIGPTPARRRVSRRRRRLARLDALEARRPVAELLPKHGRYKHNALRLLENEAAVARQNSGRCLSSVCGFEIFAEQPPRRTSAI